MESNIKKLRLGVCALVAILIAAIAMLANIPFVRAAAEQTDTPHFSYDFTDPDVKNSMRAYYQAGSGAGSGEVCDFDEYWKVDNDGVLIRQNGLGGNDIATSYAELYFDRKFDCFEINYQISATIGTVGWSGIMFNKQNLTSTFIFDGDSAFIRTDLGHAFFWGQSLGAATDENTATGVYSGLGYNDIKVKVYGTNSAPQIQHVEFWVNGKEVLHNTKAKAVTEGSVCLFTTTGSANFKNVSINRLSSSGDKLDYVPVKTIELGQTVTDVNIGDTLNLSTSVLPETATENGIIYSSQDLSTAIVSPTGKVTFINSGAVTITATSKDNSKLIEEITFNVTAKVSGIQITNKIESAVVGDSYTLAVNILPTSTAETLEFSSSDENIATISATGEVSFKGAGSVIIKVRGITYQGITDSMTVKVEGKEDKGCGAAIPFGGKSGVGTIIILVSATTLMLAGVLGLRRKKRAIREGI